MVVQALEFELLAKDQEIWLREEYNIKFKHVEETLHAENAWLQVELAEAWATSMISNMSHSNRVQVGGGHLVKLANLLL